MSRVHNPRVIEELRDRIAHLESSAAQKAIVLPSGVREMDERLSGGGYSYQRGFARNGPDTSNGDLPSEQ